MPKNSLLVAVLILALAVFAGYIFALRQHPVGDSKQVLVYARVTAPNNSNISKEQKFLYENLLTRASGSDEYSKSLGVAFSTSVSADTVSISDGCTPSVPVLKMFPHKKVEFVNTSKSNQDLHFGKVNIELKPAQSRSLHISSIFPEYNSPKGMTVRSYTCTGTPGPAGFIVLLPD